MVQSRSVRNYPRGGQGSRRGKKIESSRPAVTSESGPYEHWEVILCQTFLTCL